MTEARRARALVLLVRAGLAVAVLGGLIGVVTARVIVSGEEEIAASTAALVVGDAHEATVRARRAAGWYAPGAPHVRVAYERLVAIAQAAEGVGDRDAALLAWRSVRTASIETRWLLTPHADDARRADEAIARLEATAVRTPPTGSPQLVNLEQRQLDALRRDETPRVGWVVALVAAFGAWIAGGTWAFRRSVTETGHVLVSRAIPGLVLTAAGISLWILAVWRA